MAGAETNIWIGTANTAILLTSSATIAAAVWAGRAGLRGQVLWGLALTALMGVAFMVLKAIEYHEDFSKALIPGSPKFPIPDAGAEVFFSFYWIMTAVHAVHLSIGIGAVVLAALRLWRGTLEWRKTAFLHVLGLYWHLIDVIWIFLFPLFYLLGRGG
jgi:cytochrome c oxidase subunit 3